MNVSTTALESRLQQAREQQGSYEPSQTVKARLSQISFTGLVGPTAVGKSRLIEKAAEIDAHFSEMANLTTRKRRESDSDNYTTDIPKETFLEMIEAGELAQYVVHPATLELYGSSVDCYKTDFVVAPILSHSVSDFEKLGFKRTVTIGVIAEGIEWLERLEERKKDPEYAKRLEEAQTVLEWLEAQLSDSPFALPTVINRTDELDKAAQAVIDHSRYDNWPTAHHLKLLRTIIGMRIVANQEIRAMR